ncbi:DUF2339 domain-containing protein [Paucibacter sp. Y2R2-4]|uniref:DUF2339 domain-containing protein n=1 Tax=Paucibacter sp. Y2R2-4 TaxID=2893553 RepID=UPI0021E4F87F|nr:DUF2339 domain-containing protein [Paucibacter sp. Y2R2-4]MCV2349406.1 DUF2339 domain-containing protein [Paucibacter sp. Y2R2-4]
MNWFALIAGLAVAWFVGQLFGALGGLVVLGGLGGVFLGQIHKRLERLATELAALKKASASPQASASAQDIPLAPPVVTATPQPSKAPFTALTSPPQALPAEAIPEFPEPRVLTPTMAPAPAVAEAVEEQSASITSSLGASLLAWFRGGNTIVRVGVLILFIGVAFLLRYAAEHSQLSIELRLVGVALAGLALTGLGLRLTPKRRGYGLSLQGAGVGLTYLLLFAAYRIYGVLPVGLSFGLLAALAAVTTVLALRQDALVLAALGFGGAFLAPVLTSTGQGSHSALFSYQLLLNLAIAWMARHKAWKLLNLEGFVFTFGIGAAWGYSAYKPELFWSTEPFLLAHFLLYLYITVQYALRLTEARAQDAAPEKPALALVDGSLLFGLPIVAFGLQAALLRGQPMALAFSAAALAAIYLLVGQTLWKRAGGRLLLLIEGMVALGLIFLALVTPLALDARWSSAAWSLQGAGVLWIALRQRRWWAAVLGLLLQVGAAFSLGLAQLQSGSAAGGHVFFNSIFLGALLLTLACGFSAFCLHRLRQQSAAEGVESKSKGLAHGLRSPMLEGLMLAIAAATLWRFGLADLLAWDQGRLDTPALACLWSGLLVLGLALSQRLHGWPGLRWVERSLMTIALLYSGAALLDMPGPHMAWNRYFQGWGLLEALLLLALGLWRLAAASQASSESKIERRSLALEHLLLAWYAVLQGGFFLYTLASELIKRHEGWTPAAAIVLPTLLGLGLLARLHAQRWPMRAQDGLQTAYQRGLLQPGWLLLLIWVWLVNVFCDAAMAPLPYLPLLNPLDLAHGLVLIYGLKLWRQLGPSPARLMQVLALGAAFWWLNSLLVRSLHHWADTPMWLYGALESAPVQTGLSVLWTICALLTMLWATRRAPSGLARPVWMAGAVLLGVVVLKLFLIDLSHLGSLQRIISFLAVGGLMLVIGYVSPLPPSAAPPAPKSAPKASPP